MVILEGAVVEAEAFQLSSFANALGLAAPCIDGGPLNSSRFFLFFFFLRQTIHQNGKLPPKSQHCATEILWKQR